MIIKDKSAIIKRRYNRYSYFYDVLEAPMEILFAKWRKELIKYSSGKVLEVGVGTGKNLKYYPDAVNLTAIDFSEGMLAKALKKHKNKPNIKFLQMDIQATNFEPDTFDTVIASYVLCSVPDPVKGFRELKRICRNNGKIILLEHVRSDNKTLGYLMDLLNPLIVSLLGFNINRNTEINIVSAGIHNYQVRYLLFDVFRMFIIKNKK